MLIGAGDGRRGAGMSTSGASVDRGGRSIRLVSSGPSFAKAFVAPSKPTNAWARTPNPQLAGREGAAESHKFGGLFLLAGNIGTADTRYMPWRGLWMKSRRIERLGGSSCLPWKRRGRPVLCVTEKAVAARRLSAPAFFSFMHSSALRSPLTRSRKLGRRS